MAVSGSTNFELDVADYVEEAFERCGLEVRTGYDLKTAKRSLVKTNVTLDDGTLIPVHYDLVNRGDRWLIFNVKVEGVSYVSNFRTELDSEIRTSSLQAVIDRLETDAESQSDQ